MSDVQTCLSVFAVAAWADNSRSLEQMRKAIEAYVVKQPPESELAALTVLQEAFRSMQVDSAAANAIRAEIANRITLLSAVANWTEAQSRSTNA